MECRVEEAAKAAAKAVGAPDWEEGRGSACGTWACLDGATVAWATPQT